LLEKVSVQLQPPADKLAEEIKELGGEPPARIV
jgi:DNA-binding ferritin-like protein